MMTQLDGAGVFAPILLLSVVASVPHRTGSDSGKTADPLEK